MSKLKLFTIRFTSFRNDLELDKQSLNMLEHISLNLIDSKKHNLV